MEASALLGVAIREAQAGLAEGGLPIGAAFFDSRGMLLGEGRNRRVQNGDPSAHAETEAFRRMGRRPSYGDVILVTTLAPCWYCSGLVKQFGIREVIVGEAVNFQGGIDWLREGGVRLDVVNSDVCIAMLRDYIAANPRVWCEDIGACD